MKTYTIKKGKHYPSGIHMGITFKNSVKFRCMFSESCLYDLHGVDNYDINKLYGFSTTWHHHIQSARVGWRCIDGKNIQLLTYSYNDSERDIDDEMILGTVKPHEWFTCDISDNDDSFDYHFIDNHDNYEYGKDEKQKKWFPFNYILFPYFGGNRTAPHDMKIFLQKL